MFVTAGTYRLMRTHLFFPAHARTFNRYSHDFVRPRLGSSQHLFRVGIQGECTAEELKALEEKATSTIDVLEFVPLSTVDREYMDKVYYLGPDKGGDRAYRLLAAALKETGRAALGQYAARGQQHLVLLRPRNGVLVMEQLHYADEVRPTTEVTIPAGDVKEAELKLAKQLIDQTSNEAFEPAKYKDTVRERVLETIQRKVDGQDITSDVTPGADTKMLDLMQALKASLAGEKPKKEKGEAKRKAS